MENKRTEDQVLVGGMLTVLGAGRQVIYHCQCEKAGVHAENEGMNNESAPDTWPPGRVL